MTDTRVIRTFAGAAPESAEPLSFRRDIFVDRLFAPLAGQADLSVGGLQGSDSVSTRYPPLKLLPDPIPPKIQFPSSSSLPVTRCIRTVLVLVLGFAFGVALGQEARLSNMSVRAQAGGGDSLITGFTIGPGARKTVLVRAVGPTLRAFGVEGALADPKLTLYDSSGTKLAENDDFNAADAQAFGSVGAFQLTPGGKDAALVATLGPGGYTAEVSGVGGARGVTLVEVYEVGASETRLMNLSTRAQAGAGDAILIPGITISAGSGARRLLVRAVGPALAAFGVAGTVSDPKLELFSGSTRIAANDNWETQSGNAGGTGAQLSAAFSQAGAFALSAGSKDAALLTTLAPGSYTLQVSGANSATGEALVEVYDITDSGGSRINPVSNLFFAQIRPSANAPGSLASGFAAISFASDGNATVSVNISNLSSAQTAAYLRLAGTGDYVLSLPLGQVARRPWVLGPVGIYTRDDIVKALNEGKLYVSLDTAKYPAGEAVGTMLTAAGSTRFTPPAAPPALSETLFSSPSDIDAARLLTQATFGPTEETIAEVKRLGVRGWIDAQLALPQTSFHQTIREDAMRFPNPLKRPDGTPNNRITGLDFDAGWWKVALTSKDQLRQRVAFALSQIFVVNADDGNFNEPYAAYYDLLGKYAFGNFRDLLEAVSLNSEMANYLTYIFNQKADPVKGTSPDENYAREIQQLFTIGLVQLHPDGTLLLDAGGTPIPTYDNRTIAETAKVFTGWAYTSGRASFLYDPTWEQPGGFSNSDLFSLSNGRLQPLRNFPAFHDQGEKRIISLEQLPPSQARPTIIPPNGTGLDDLRLLLDTLFKHPNTGPFITRQLIQRLVTSNPSPGYVHRIAQVFANNGRGVRGDLSSVIKSILTDHEARSAAVAALAGFGKIKEPVLRLSGLMRVLKAAAPNGRYLDGYHLEGTSYPKSFVANKARLSGFFHGSLITETGQAPLRAPSVFNFFSPSFSAPGPLADAGLVAPELEIVDSTLSVTAPNALIKLIHRSDDLDPEAPSPDPFVRTNLSSWLSISDNADALVERLALLLSPGSMSAPSRDVIRREVVRVPSAQPIQNFSSARQRALNTAGGRGMVAPKTADFDPGAEFTMEAWVHPTEISATGYYFIAGKRPLFASPYSLFQLMMVPGGKISADLSNGTTSSRGGITSADALPLGAWTHVAATYDSAILRLYLNGSVVAQSNVSKVVTPSSPNAPFSIGEGISPDGRSSLSSFMGLISQARLWRVARSPEQIQQGMKEGIPSNRTGLVGNWLLDEGSGAVAKDSSGNGRDLQSANPTGPAAWMVTDGKSLERVQLALHMITVSPDSALQR